MLLVRCLYDARLPTRAVAGQAVVAEFLLQEAAAPSEGLPPQQQ